MNYYELDLKINPEMSEVISDILFDSFDCVGIVTEEVYYRKFRVASTSSNELRVYLQGEEEPNCEKILKEQKELLLSRGLTEEDLGSWEYKLTPIEITDWSQKWKESWKATHVNEKLVIVPSWVDYEQRPNEMIINLDPGCAFGTGIHPSTQLCMKDLLAHFKEGQTMADIGTGSGILSILAKKLGASETFGCDNDERVIAVARENAKLNNVDCEFEFTTADKMTKQYDFVCANILHNVLIEIMDDLADIMKPHAKLSLSGILKELAPEVWVAIKRANLSIIEENVQGMWMSFLVEKDKW